MPALPPDAHAVRRWLRRQAALVQAALVQAPWLHEEVARRMAERLSVIRSAPATVLDWWGHFSGSAQPLAQACPHARRIVVVPTPALQQRTAAAPAPWWSPRRWSAATAPVLEAEVPPASGQLLWANMMLHAVSDAPALMAAWRRAIAVDGFLMFSCFGPDTLAELRALYTSLGWPPPAIAFTDMHDIGDALVHAGFADPVMDQEHLTLTWDSPGALLAELRTLGANTHPERFAGLRTPRWRQRLEHEIGARLAGADGRLRLTFEIVYGHAFNPAPRPRVAGRTEVSLDEMRTMVKSSRGRGDGGQDIGP
jgi:malonyl-CoA O-methyltransferase